MNNSILFVVYIIHNVETMNNENKYELFNKNKLSTFCPFILNSFFFSFNFILFLLRNKVSILYFYFPFCQEIFIVFL